MPKMKRRRLEEEEDGRGKEGRRVERHKERMWEGSKQAWMRRRPFQLLQLGVSLYILCLSFFSYQRQGIVQWHQTDGDSTLLYLAPLYSNCIVSRPQCPKDVGETVAQWYITASLYVGWIRYSPPPSFPPCLEYKSERMAHTVQGSGFIFSMHSLGWRQTRGKKYLRLM